MQLPAVRPTLLDRAVGFFNPIAGAQRMRARAFMSFLRGVGGHRGATGDRWAKEWHHTSGASADSDNHPDLPTLRARSRDLVRNAPIATGAVKVYVTSVVGTGLRLQAQCAAALLGLTPAQAKAWNRRTEQLWRMWAGTRQCDITRRQTFADLQDMVLRSELESGDILVIFRAKLRPGEPFWTRLQVVEADRISNPNYTMDTDRLRDGVELDKDGAPIAYHVLNQSPGDAMTGPLEWARVPAFASPPPTGSGEPMTLHIAHLTRPGQTRGVPLLSPVIEALKQLTRYGEAEIMAAVISSMFTVFVKHAPGDTEGTGLTEIPRDGSNAATTANTATSELKLGNGAVLDLLDGEEIQQANPMRPNSQFDPFVVAWCQQIGAALEIPFEVLLKRFTASYSAAQGALQEFWRSVLTRRARLERQFCQPVYERWMYEMVARDLIVAPGFLEDPFARRAWLGATWTGDARGTLDPLKEAKAAALRIETAISTRKIEASELNGVDWEEEIVDQLAAEHETLRTRGLLPEPAAAPVARLPAGKDEDEDEDPDEADRKELAGVA